MSANLSSSVEVEAVGTRLQRRPAVLPEATSESCGGFAFIRRAGDGSGEPLRLLCLSNGHGEDEIAVRILQELQQYPIPPELSALPIVGEGRAYRQLGIPLVGRVQAMPSGGFVYQDGRQLVRDLRGGLLQLTLDQLQTVRAWARQGGAILAVGDIVPLLFAWLSGATYAFVGTARSEYYLRDETGLLPQRKWLGRLEGWSGSVYHPWERWLMSHPHCKAVFPRDSLTAKILQKWSMPVFDLGNPMMDRLEPLHLHQEFYDSKVEHQEQERSLSIVLLPGSRVPEAYANWQQILVGVAALLETYQERKLLFLGAIAPGLSLEPLCQILLDSGFKALESENSLPIPNRDILTFSYKNGSCLLAHNVGNDFLHMADIAIAMTGTATEQFVGLGKPAIIIPGKGPQFTPAFAEAQSRLLGPSVILVEQPRQVGRAVQSLLNAPDRLQLIAENGCRRMGKPGAARSIAVCLMEQLQQNGA
ncbi:MAG: hypothetical protein JOZ78_00930 [Chroococcidiopsidaceae cyanobacterium CP_BM_ER_R8_30]|nr:hypothetical protein [Chroococcidiopsidaceae cyanobacterium CP_BM_ER_R8_30]